MGRPKRSVTTGTSPIKFARRNVRLDILTRNLASLLLYSYSHLCDGWKVENFIRVFRGITRIGSSHHKERGRKIVSPNLCG
jgi:hypothetical protein